MPIIKVGSIFTQNDFVIRSESLSEQTCKVLAQQLVLSVVDVALLVLQSLIAHVAVVSEHQFELTVLNFIAQSVLNTLLERGDSQQFSITSFKLLN